jgi:hypothetical protein
MINGDRLLVHQPLLAVPTRSDHAHNVLDLGRIDWLAGRNAMPLKQARPAAHCGGMIFGVCATRFGPTLRGRELPSVDETEA